MKKAWSLLFTLVLCLALCACNETPNGGMGPTLDLGSLPPDDTLYVTDAMPSQYEVYLYLNDYVLDGSLSHIVMPTRLQFRSDGTCHAEFPDFAIEQSMDLRWSYAPNNGAWDRMYIRIGTQDDIWYIMWIVEGGGATIAKHAFVSTEDGTALEGLQHDGYTGMQFTMIPDGSASGGSQDQDQDQDQEQLKPEDVAGTYVSMRERDDRPRTVELLADQSCRIDGRELRWELSGDEEYEVSILDGDTVVHSIRLTDEEGLVWMRVGEDEFIYLNLADYERIELTPDNWSEYFEIKEAFNISKNPFGDFVRAEVEFHYYLKDSYYQRIYNKDGSSQYYQDDVAVEVEYVRNPVSYTIDPEKGTYTITSVGEPSTDKTIVTVFQSNDCFLGRISHIPFHELSGEYYIDGGYPSRITPLRVKGHLWLKLQH